MARLTKKHKEQILNAMDSHLFNKKALELDKKWNNEDLYNGDGMKLYRLFYPTVVEMQLRQLPPDYLSWISHFELNGHKCYINDANHEMKYPITSRYKLAGDFSSTIFKTYPDHAWFSTTEVEKFIKALKDKGEEFLWLKTKNEREKEFRLLRIERNSFRKKLENTLQYITTTKKLRDNVPDVWNAVKNIMPQDGTTAVPAVILTDFQTAIEEAKAFTVETKKAQLTVVANQVKENNDAHAKAHNAQN